MNYWWVNQNQTYRHEIAGEYMWSPKFNKNNRKNPYYDNMVKVSPGDLVYSFIDTKIQYIGIIQSRGFSYLKPGEFGSEGDAWDDEGWKVRVIYYPLENIIRPKNHIDQLRQFLPDKYSPLQKDSGNGIQSIYLTYIPDELSNKINELIGSEVRIIEERSRDCIGIELSEREAIEEQKVIEIQRDVSISNTEKEALVKSRVGQGKFRNDVIELFRRCPFTKIENAKFLRAGHLKPWSKCNNYERLDPHNGLPLTPTFDLLIDRGYLSFDDSGSLLISDQFSKDEISKLELPENFKLNIINDSQLSYIRYHREEIFR